MTLALMMRAQSVPFSALWFLVLPLLAFPLLLAARWNARRVVAALVIAVALSAAAAVYADDATTDVMMRCPKWWIGCW
jgi:hypothetical protein